MNITKRYIHPQEKTILDAMEKAPVAKGGHKTGHNSNSAEESSQRELAAINSAEITSLARPERLELPTYWFEVMRFPFHRRPLRCILLIFVRTFVSIRPLSPHTSIGVAVKLAVKQICELSLKYQEKTCGPSAVHRCSGG